jgi:hypothetical protein
MDGMNACVALRRIQAGVHSGHDACCQYLAAPLLFVVLHVHGVLLLLSSRQHDAMIALTIMADHGCASFTAVAGVGFVMAADLTG